MTAITTRRSTADMHEFSVNDLYLATLDDWLSISFAASVGLLPNTRKCERCSRPMHLVSRQENIDKKRVKFANNLELLIPALVDLQSERREEKTLLLHKIHQIRNVL